MILKLPRSFRCGLSMNWKFDPLHSTAVVILIGFKYQNNNNKTLFIKPFTNAFLKHVNLTVFYLLECVISAVGYLSLYIKY